MTLGTTFVFEFGGLEALSFAVTRLENFADDLTPMWSVVDAELRAALHEEFASEGNMGGIGGWKDTTPEHHPILYRTGSLEDSLTIESDAGHIFEPFPTYMVFGTSIERDGFYYPSAIQEGTSRMPARPIFDEQVLEGALTGAINIGARAVSDLWSPSWGNTAATNSASLDAAFVNAMGG